MVYVPLIFAGLTACERPPTSGARRDACVRASETFVSRFDERVVVELIYPAADF